MAVPRKTVSIETIAQRIGAEAILNARPLAEGIVRLVETLGSADGGAQGDRGDTVSPKCHPAQTLHSRHWSGESAAKATGYTFCANGAGEDDGDEDPGHRGHDERREASRKIKPRERRGIGDGKARFFPVD
jgi:hypothetical protein